MNNPYPARTNQSVLARLVRARSLSRCKLYLAAIGMNSSERTLTVPLKSVNCNRTMFSPFDRRTFPFRGIRSKFIGPFGSFGKYPLVATLVLLRAWSPTDTEIDTSGIDEA